MTALPSKKIEGDYVVVPTYTMPEAAPIGPFTRKLIDIMKRVIYRSQGPTKRRRYYFSLYGKGYDMIWVNGDHMGVLKYILKFHKLRSFLYRDDRLYFYCYKPSKIDRIAAAIAKLGYDFKIERYE